MISQAIHMTDFTHVLLSLSYFYSAPQCWHCKRCTSYSNSVRLPVCLSVCLSVTRQYCVKTTERRMILSSLEDRKMCLVFRQPKKRPPRNDRFPLKCCPKSSEF